MTRNEMLELIQAEVAKHLTNHWRIEIKHVRAGWFGRCSHRAGHRQGTLTFNEPIRHLDRDLLHREVILHEIAHAIEVERHGSSDHGPRWQRIARSLGVTPDPYLYLEQLPRNWPELIDAKYVLACETCDLRDYAFRMDARRRQGFEQGRIKHTRCGKPLTLIQRR